MTGTVQASTDKGVFIQGKNPVLVGDSTTESETYSLGSDERYLSGQHSGANAKGTVTTGNSKNVYIGGRLVCNDPTSVRTHAVAVTTISGGSESTTVFIG